MAKSENSGRTDSVITAAFAAELAAVLESMTGERPSLEVGSPEASAPPEDQALAWKQEFPGASIDPAWIIADVSGAVGIGARMLRAAGVVGQDEADAKSTYLEVVNQALSGLTRVLGAKTGRNVLCNGGAESPAPTDLMLAPIRMRFADASEVTVYAHFEAPQSNEPENDQSPPAAAPPSNSKNIDLLLDVELPVTVSFGRAQLPLKDVVKLTTGSIVELNRTLSEPVELIVNNCVIALGEVVVVDGNFAIRIQRVMSRRDRLQTVS